VPQWFRATVHCEISSLDWKIVVIQEAFTYNESMVMNNAPSTQRLPRFSQCALYVFVGFLFMQLPPTWIHAQTTTEIISKASHKKKNGPIPVRLIISQHRRIIIPEAIQRVAVGDTDMVSAQLINNKEVLLLGHRAGRTTMIVWLQSGRIKQFICHIERDLSVLQAALTNIHPNIRVSSAPDREALVLTGTVPAIRHRLSAEAITQKYLDAGTSRSAEDAEGPVVKGNETAQSDGKSEKGSEGEGLSPSTDEATSDTVSLSSRVRSIGTIINLIQVETLPLNSTQRIQEAIHSIGGENVRVRRVQRGQAPDDAQDVFLLEGTVKNQVVLLRILEVASRILTGKGTSQESIRVIGNEAGGLEGRRNQRFQQSGTSGGGTGGALGRLFGGGGSGNRGLQNLVQQNLARAKAIEAADGRILSFITVVDVPQVRVNVKLYELNRTKLRSYNADLVGVHDNFSTSFITPPTDPSIQNVLGFLNGTAISDQFLKAGSFAVESVLIFLEQLDIARSLSSPSITVLSGELARFSVGGEIPITTLFSPFLNTTNVSSGFLETVTFREFGISLQVRPLVGENGNVTLDLRPQVVTPDPQLTGEIRESSGSNQDTVAFKTRTLSSTSRLKDGEALIIAGLLSREKADLQRFIPGLHDVSFLNWLFRKFDQNDEETDLVMIVNPVIVREPNHNVRLWVFPDHPEFALPHSNHSPVAKVPEPMS